MGNRRATAAGLAGHIHCSPAIRLRVLPLGLVSFTGLNLLPRFASATAQLAARSASRAASAWSDSSGVSSR